MKIWLVLATLMTMNQAMAAKAVVSQDVGTFSTADPVRPVKDGGIISADTVPPRVIGGTATAISGGIKGGGAAEAAPTSGVCCFSKSVIGAQFTKSTARVGVTTDAAQINPQLECQNKNGEWYANLSVCPKPAAEATVAPSTGFCCYPKNMGSTLDASAVDSASTARAANPAILCQNNGGTWKTSGSCNEVLHPTDPLPPGNEIGSCCRKAQFKGGINDDSAVPVSAMHATDRMKKMSAKEQCLLDPSMEWLTTPGGCPRIIGNGTNIEFGVCCSPVKTIVEGVKNSLSCRGDNIWRAGASSCGRTIGAPIGIGVVGEVPHIKPPTVQTAPTQVDPGASEAAPCAESERFVLDSDSSKLKCMDKGGQFKVYRGQNVCCGPYRK